MCFVSFHSCVCDAMLMFVGTIARKKVDYLEKIVDGMLSANPPGESVSVIISCIVKLPAIDPIEYSVF